MKEQCGPHMSVHMLAEKYIERMTLLDGVERDCFKHIRKCHLCQVSADNDLPTSLHCITSPLHGLSRYEVGCNRYDQSQDIKQTSICFMVIDNFTKWVTTASNLTKSQVALYFKTISFVGMVYLSLL